MPAAAACAAKLCAATSWTPWMYWQVNPCGSVSVMMMTTFADDERQPPPKALSCAPDEPVRAGSALTTVLMASSYGTPPQPPATTSLVVAGLQALRAGGTGSLEPRWFAGTPTGAN